jgi:hypothetical protein
MQPMTSGGLCWNPLSRSHEGSQDIKDPSLLRYTGRGEETRHVGRKRWSWREKEVELCCWCKKGMSIISSQAISRPCLDSVRALNFVPTAMKLAVSLTPAKIACNIHRTSARQGIEAPSRVSGTIFLQLLTSTAARTLYSKDKSVNNTLAAMLPLQMVIMCE